VDAGLLEDDARAGYLSLKIWRSVLTEAKVGSHCGGLSGGIEQNVAIQGGAVYEELDGTDMQQTRYRNGRPWGNRGLKRQRNERLHVIDPFHSFYLMRP
jgi:hypothetical protein